jgi:hypothetical protein
MKVKKNSKLYRENDFIDTVHKKIDEAGQTLSKEDSMKKELDSKVQVQIKVNMFLRYKVNNLER